MQPGGAKEAHALAADLLSAAGNGGSSTANGPNPGSSGISGSGLVSAAGGWYPDPSGMLWQQGLAG
jgi:hypothetical protein